MQDPVWYWNYGEKLGLYSEIGLPHVLSVESMRAMMPAADLWPINGTGMWTYHQIIANNTDGNNISRRSIRNTDLRRTSSNSAPRRRP